jgi:hypothetical protein
VARGESQVTLQCIELQQSVPTLALAQVPTLRASAEDALRRKFAILTLEPQSKLPYAKYSPHAVNSATINPVVALRPYADGVPANVGVACGKSNLAVVDVDKGVTSLEQLTAWMQRNTIPATLTVISGRDGFGAHLYFSGAVPTTTFDIDGVSGEVKSIGGYVVGAGSVHPSGKIYTVADDSPIAPLPDIFKSKTSAKPLKPLVVSSLVKEGGRNPWLASLAGHLRNFKGGTLSADAMYQAMKALAVTSCEGGESYAAANDDKIRDLARRATTDFEVSTDYAARRLSHSDLIAEADSDAGLANIVSPLISRKTVNIAVGDSGLGKTPFFFQMALCVSSGFPFVGQDTQRGRVLIADYENYTDVGKLIDALARYLSIPVPVASEWFNVARGLDPKDLAREIEDYRPSLVIVDSLRGYNSRAEVDNSAASDMIARCQTVAQVNDCAWMFIHHPRKQDRNVKAIERPDLFKTETPVIEWLEEAAGPRALINQTHTRLGFAKPKKHSDLGLRGFVKGRGEVGPWLINREYDDAGEPIGYKRVRGSDLLSADDKLVFNLLPVAEPMQFTKVLKVLYEGNESKRPFVANFLKRCIDAGVVTTAGKDRTPSKTYTRVTETT